MVWRMTARWSSASGSTLGSDDCLRGVRRQGRGSGTTATLSPQTSLVKYFVVQSQKSRTKRHSPSTVPLTPRLKPSTSPHLNAGLKARSSTLLRCDCFGLDLALGDFERQLLGFGVGVHLYAVAMQHFAIEDLHRQRVLHELLDRPLQRTRAVVGV